MSASEKKLRCTDAEQLLVFYACDEVSEAERLHLDEHLAVCDSCRSRLAREIELWEMVASANRVESPDALLAQCRSELAEKLDDLAAGSRAQLEEPWQPFAWLRRWMALRPAMSGVLLVFFGIVLGAGLLPWLQSAFPGNSGGRPVTVMASQKLTDEQLAKMAVAGISFSPDPNAAPGTVQLQLRAEQPIVLSGSADDQQMRRVLTYVVENGDRFDAGVRLDSLEALRSHSRDAQVRSALLAAARKDPNPAVRMKALESLRNSASEVAVRETLLDSLTHDANPGVRVEVVNMLVRSLEHQQQEFEASMPQDGVTEVPDMSGAPGDVYIDMSLAPGDVPDMSEAPDSAGAPGADESIVRVIHVLEDLQKRDPSRYVRLRSAAALRQIAPKELQ